MAVKDMRRIANVVGLNVIPSVLMAALYPYRDYEEVRQELTQLQEESYGCRGQETQRN